MTLHFGAAAADITPPVGIAMGGYWGRRSGATHIRDRLMAKALVCGCGAARIALVAVDLVGLDANAVRRIREKIRRATGIEDAAIMVCASHTHAGPLTFPFRGMGRIDYYYLEQVADAVVEAVVAAAADSRPGRLYYARPPVQIGINRREPHPQGTRIGQNPAGPVVPYAHVLRFVAADGTGVTLFNHACHPVVLGHDNLQISGDFAGAAVRHIEEQTGDRALFINGACGDVNPRITGGAFADVEALGQALGQVVLEGRDAAVPLETSSISWAHERLDLPLQPPPTRWRAELEKFKWYLRARLAWGSEVSKAQFEWAVAMCKWVRAGAERARVQTFEIQALALGELVLLGVEGELFARYHLDLETAHGPAVLCGFANGCIGYVPTADEYARGGYEIDLAYKFYPSVQMIAPTSESLIRQRAAALIAKVR
ncbi:MAG: neutral/alkaline non-lysosomal ceramidase N-terminal domain-containing protein [Gemmatimonadetes bacterium]|nr:neutral/alkaline non-lysosomal ceramidase N-terminal domain-containing protein [Gemmatimonadota bacterium]